MTRKTKETITVAATVNAPIGKVWEFWTRPEHITQWNQASDDWHSPRAENDLRIGGKFVYRMEARVGSMGFDFDGVYDVVTEHKRIEYTIADGRKVVVTFTAEGQKTSVVETFEAETQNSIDLQRTGWQAILDSFKRYAEGHRQ